MSKALRAYVLEQFGLDHLKPVDLPAPQPGPGQALLEVRALSLNYRDLLVIRGAYDPRLRLPAVPISDAAGVVRGVGPQVERVRPGDRVMTHFITGWIDGPFQAGYTATTLGLPGPGVAAEQVALPAEALLPLPAGYEFSEAATLPIAALTAWSALVTVGGLEPDGAGTSGEPGVARPRAAPHGEPPVVLTLGTGGVSIFALQFGKALGATVIITSSSDEKLARARGLGADQGINYRQRPDWERAVLEATAGRGADIVVENAGAGTLNRSLRATRAGGIVALLGVLSGLEGPVNLGLVLMKRLHVAGIMVDSRRRFEQMCRFIERHDIRPVIDRTFGFEELPAALRYMEAGRHFGKIVVTL